MVLAVTFIYPGSYGLRFDVASVGADAAGARLRAACRQEPRATGAALVAGFVRRWVITLLPCLGLVFLVRRRPTDPTGWIGLGLVIGGVAAALALWHPSCSQLYFPILALPIAYALSGAGVGLFLAGLRERRERGPERRRALGPRPERLPPPQGTPAAHPRHRRHRHLAALVEPLTRRLVPSGGATPRTLADGEGIGLEQAWTWIAPPVAVLVALLILAHVGAARPAHVHVGAWPARGRPSSPCWPSPPAPPPSSAPSPSVPTPAHPGLGRPRATLRTHQRSRPPCSRPGSTSDTTPTRTTWSPPTGCGTVCEVQGRQGQP